MRFPIVALLCACVLILAVSLLAQSPNGVLNGLVVDPANRAIVGADVVTVNDVTGIQYTAKTNEEGIYVLSHLPPGPYRLQVSKIGFKTLIKPDITLNVQDALAINFTLPIGALSETVTVEGGAPLVNTESATVSTVVDRQFAENLPLNGRSFQTLIQLTPGVVPTGYDNHDNGQFSINGQRASSNYWMVDGVGANIGIGASLYSGGNGLSGSVGSFSTLGGTNSLVSVDAMQEFRIQTSTFAPEFGRTPGGQISIVTRSGTNRFHGTLFDYFRNDALDANDWFAGLNGLPKPQERQNDFGGTFSGPVIRNRTFFFFSYEGLRLRLPEVAQSLVPDGTARQNAIPAMQSYLNAFPLPTPGALDNIATGVAQFNASFSNQAALDAYSLRIDHKLNDKLTFFGRYNDSPSSALQRGISGGNLSSVFPTNITTQTATAGATWLISPTTVNELRFNYSKTNSRSSAFLDDLGGATPLTSLPFPSPYTAENAILFIIIPGLTPGGLVVGPQGNNLQRQINVVDSVSAQKGSHGLKFGVDARRLSPFLGTPDYEQEGLFRNVPNFAAGNVFLHFITSGRSGTVFFHNFGAYAQDTWRLKRLTVTYGLRWDLDFAPSSNLNLLAVTGFNLSDLSNLALAPSGTPPFKTTYGNLAPRLGVAYDLLDNHQWQTVLRGGFGAFYDLATSEAGNNLYFGVYPFGALTAGLGGSFPLNPTTAAPPPINIGSLKAGGLYAFDPALKLPYTLQWNFALEQTLGLQQAISASYVGAAGRRLLQTANVNSPNASFASAQVVANAATSDYHALQVQFKRRLSKGIQALTSYTWSHSIDTGSAGSLYGNSANGLTPSLINSNRGSSDFDIRHALSVGLTYNVPTPTASTWARPLLGGWSLQNVFQARSATPVTIFDGQFFYIKNDYAEIRPDVVAGHPLYLYGPEYPGGKAFNPAAFVSPPTDSDGNPLRQGDLGRNAVRAFGSQQWDFAVHRDFALHESMNLQFRAELFNVLNHPNFAPPVADIGNQTQFGRSTQMLGRSLAGSNVGSGGFSPLYQLGGPRSVQLALKLQF